MPIETDIPLEIDRYRKKLVFGLTGRQFVCLALALLLAGGAYALCTILLRMDTDDAGWVVMLVAIPALTIGFVEPGGEPFERIARRKLRHALWSGHLHYAALPGPCGGRAEKERKGGTRHGADPTARAAEATYRFRRSKVGRKRKRRQTARRIQAAQKEHRRATARARQTADSAAHRT